MKRILSVICAGIFMFFRYYEPSPELVFTLEWCFGAIAVAAACWVIGHTVKDFRDWFKRGK